MSNSKEYFCLREVLRDLHSFNKLTDRDVKMFTETTGIDAAELCKEEGITYRLTDTSINFDDKADEIDEAERNCNE